MVSRLSISLCVLTAGVVWGAPQMFVWNCDGCPYGTQVSRAAVEFASDSQVTGDLIVEHIVGEDGSNSLEIRGPIDGLKVARTMVRIHEGADCESQLLHQERCNNCQQYISMKVLASRKSLSIGGENDVMNKAVSIFDTRRGKVLGCGKIVTPTDP